MEGLDAIRVAIHARRSVRRGFTGLRISRECLLDIVAAGVAAPSGSNTQAIRFLVETRAPEMLRLSRIRKVAGDVLTAGSALVLVFVDRDKDLSGSYWSSVWRQLAYQDSAAAIQNMLLLAAGYGLGACWVSAFANMAGTPLLDRKTWAEALEPYALPSSFEIMGIVVLGRVQGAEALAGDPDHQGRPVARGPVNDYLAGFFEAS